MASFVPAPEGPNTAARFIAAGHRVRLQPDRTSPQIGRVDTGDLIGWMAWVSQPDSVAGSPPYNWTFVELGDGTRGWVAMTTGNTATMFEVLDVPEPEPVPVPGDGVLMSREELLNLIELIEAVSEGQYEQWKTVVVEMRHVLERDV